jgi:hypothetical protein
MKRKRSLVVLAGNEYDQGACKAALRDGSQTGSSFRWATFLSPFGQDNNRGFFSLHYLSESDANATYPIAILSRDSNMSQRASLSRRQTTFISANRQTIGFHPDGLKAAIDERLGRGPLSRRPLPQRLKF